MSFAHYYEKGLAVGTPDIRTDCIVFHYNGEEIPVHAVKMLSHPKKAKFNGCHYLARIKDVRKAAKEP